MNRLIIALTAVLMTACGNSKSSVTTTESAEQPVGPVFSADSAYKFCQEQCDFGPRTMNSEAHERCGEWIADKFRQYGLEVTLQRADLYGYDGTKLKSTNIIASYKPEQASRVLVCAHWDSRPWADNDPDEANHHKPVLAANDGASGVAVMLEVARQIDSLQIGVDFICFDAEDWGAPQWVDGDDVEGYDWALGAHHWSENLHREGYTARYGILLDMVGGQGAQFYQERFSLDYASDVVRRVWTAAEVLGYSGYFPKREGGMITDDHVPVNQKAKIPCIDIIPYYPDCQASSFGPTWHTVNDNMQHIDKNTLQAVGQTLVQVLFSEK